MTGIQNQILIRFMPSRSSKRPTDANQLAKLMVDIATGNATESIIDPQTGKNPAAVALGRLGGKKGGVVRAERLSPERRAEIAAEAAKARWRRTIDGGSDP